MMKILFLLLILHFMVKSIITTGPDSRCLTVKEQESVTTEVRLQVVHNHITIISRIPTFLTGTLIAHESGMSSSNSSMSNTQIL